MERISFWLEGISYSPSLHNNTTHIPGLHIVNLSHGLPRQPLRLKLANPPSILTFGWLLSANNSVRGKKREDLKNIYFKLPREAALCKCDPENEVLLPSEL